MQLVEDEGWAVVVAMSTPNSRPRTLVLGVLRSQSPGTERELLIGDSGGARCGDGGGEGKAEEIRSDGDVGLDCAFGYGGIGQMGAKAKAMWVGRVLWRPRLL